MEVIPSASEFLSLRNGTIGHIQRPIKAINSHLAVESYMIHWILDWVCDKNDRRDKIELRLTHMLPRNIICDWESVLMKKGYYVVKFNDSFVVSAYPIDMDSLILSINNSAEDDPDELSNLLNSATLIDDSSKKNDEYEPTFRSAETPVRSDSEQSADHTDDEADFRAFGLGEDDSDDIFSDVLDYQPAVNIDNTNLASTNNQDDFQDDDINPVLARSSVALKNNTPKLKRTQRKNPIRVTTKK